jgi:hypothetical protein
MKKIVMAMIALAGTLVYGQTNQLSVHWLVREDIFAGLLENDKVRMDKGLETLDRVAAYYDEVDVLSWRYAGEVMKGVWAYEAKDRVAFDRHYGLALTYLGRMRQVGKGRGTIVPDIFEGAVMTMLGDRLPPEMRKGAAERGYKAYARLAEVQAAELEKSPMHIKGEVWAGVAAGAYATGREAELKQALERIMTGMPKTPYAMVAKKWMDDPAARGKVKMVCISCHEPNRLGPRVVSAQGQ